MSISQEIQRIKTNIANAYTQAKNKGATLPQSQNSANLASTIKSIPGGSGLEVKHGIVYTEVDEDGYVTKAKVVGLNTVPYASFYNNETDRYNKLKKVELSEEITTIKKYAFRECASLENINIPDNVTSVLGYAFQDCRGLKSIEFSNNIVTIGEYAFYNCIGLKDINIPDNVTTIETSTFSGCKSLTSINIPNSVTSIKNSAFTNCSGMAFYDFSSHTVIPTLSNKNAFAGIPSDCRIIVPDSLYEDWKVATNWSTYASYIIKKSDLEASQV